MQSRGDSCQIRSTTIALPAVSPGLNVGLCIHGEDPPGPPDLDAAEIAIIEKASNDLLTGGPGRSESRYGQWRAAMVRHRAVHSRGVLIGHACIVATDERKGKQASWTTRQNDMER